jgi:hypothetical protein
LGTGGSGVETQVRCVNGVVQLILDGQLVRAWRQRHTPEQELRMFQRPNPQQRTAKVTGTVVGGPKAWRYLGHARRRDLLHHVRQGRPDPDPVVWAVAVGWARWLLAVPWWRRLARATAVTLGVYVAVGALVVPLMYLLPGSSVEVARGYGWIVTTAWQLCLLAYWFGVIPWLDARKIDRLSRPTAAKLSDAS